MALSDLLWACPECGEDRGLRADGAGYRCHACDTLFKRDDGAAILAVRPDGSRSVRGPAEWLEQLPGPEEVMEAARREGGDDPVLRAATVMTSQVTDSEVVRDREGFLNRVEVWGEERRGRLEIRQDRLIYAPDGGSAPEAWPLQSLTAVQASSSSLQINRRDAPLVSFSFQDDSVHLWEQLMRVALRDFYGRTGRGDIVEFQPRIVTT